MKQAEFFKSLGDASEERGHSLKINIPFERIVDEAPSDASVMVAVKKGADGYRGLVKIHSANRSFSAGRSNPHLSRLLQDLVADIHSRLEEWKNSRSFDVPATSLAR